MKRIDMILVPCENLASTFKSNPMVRMKHRAGVYIMQNSMVVGGGMAAKKKEVQRKKVKRGNVKG